MHKLNRCKKIIRLSPLMAMAGCVTPYSPPPVATLPPANGPHRAPVEQSRPELAAPVAILPDRGSHGGSASQAVDALLDEGWALYGQSRYDASISVAERALRIDRRRPELYRLLSRNYLATLQLQQAEQQARRGLSIGAATAGQRAALEQLLQEILAAY